MDILTNYRNRIVELAEELNHCVGQYNRLILKEKTEKKTNTVKYKEKEKRKSCQKE